MNVSILHIPGTAIFSKSNTTSKYLIDNRLITNRFFSIDNFFLVSSIIFKILKLHFLIIFRFCADILSSIAFASSRNVTSRCQCMLSILQCPLSARLNVSMSPFRLLIKYQCSIVFLPFFSMLFLSIAMLSSLFSVSATGYLPSDNIPVSLSAVSFFFRFLIISCFFYLPI